MNVKSFISTGFAVFISFCAMDFVIHGILLSPDYSAIQNVWRTDMNSLMWMMYLATFVFSFVFVWLFARGYNTEGIMEGLVFGLLTGIGMNIMAAIGQYAMYPLPSVMCIKWFIFGTVEYCIAGVVASLVYRD